MFLLLRAVWAPRLTLNHRLTHAHAYTRTQFELPTGKNFSLEKMSQAALVHQNQLIAITLTNTTKLSHKTHDKVSGYHVPEHVEYELTGTTEAGLPVHVSVKAPLRHRLDRIDVLAELPYLLRLFISTFVTAPWVYQWFEEGVVDVQIGEGERFQIKGQIFHEKTFMMN